MLASLIFHLPTVCPLPTECYQNGSNQGCKLLSNYQMQRKFPVLCYCLILFFLKTTLYYFNFHDDVFIWSPEIFLIMIIFSVSLLLPTIKISVSLRKYNHNFKYQYILMATKSVFPSQTVLIFKYVCLYTYLMGFMLMHISTIELNSKTQLYIFDSISFLYSRISQKFFMWGSKNCVS